MNIFRTFLIAFVIALTGYTLVTISNQGWNLFPFFFGDMKTMGWAGQFNFDFMGFLALSAIWTAWRNQFSASGLGLAVVAFLGGMMFLSLYLLYLSFQCEGSAKRMLVGDGR